MIPKNRPRRNTTISLEVMNLLETPDEVIDVDEGIDPDLADELNQLGLKIGKKNENNKYDLTIKNVGASSFQEDEVEWMIRVLHGSEIKHALAVVRLHVCKAGETEWGFSNIVGGAALVTESNLQNKCAHFIRIVDLNGFNPNKSVIFQQEFYYGLKYHKEAEFFHTFEGSDVILGLSFASGDEANYFYEKVQYCLTHNPTDVIQEMYDEKEKSYMLVGDKVARVANGTSISVRTRQKYAEGGITDGIEVKWSRPAIPETLKEFIPQIPQPVEEEETLQPKKDRRRSVYKESEVIDLMNSNVPRADRSMSIALGASPTLFSEGNANISDGTSYTWAKNATSLTSHVDQAQSPKSPEEMQRELELKIKRLKEKRKAASDSGDKEAEKALASEIHNLTIQIRSLYQPKQKNPNFFKKMLKVTS